MSDKESLKPLEEEIEELAKEFYSIPKDDENYISKRDRQKSMLIKNLLDYYEKIHGKKFVKKYSSTIFLTLENTSQKDENKKIGILANYSSERGPFLNYCNRSVKIQIQRKIAKENNNKYTLAWKKLQKLSKIYGYSIDTFENAMQFGRKLGWSESEIKETWDFGRIQIISEIKKTSDGEEVSNFDIAAEKQYSEKENIETEFQKQETEKGLLCKVDNVFEKQQDRIKPYLSALLTQYFTSKKCENKYGMNLLKILGDDAEILKKISFINKPVLEEIRKNSKLRQQDVAEKFGRDKTDASRTLNKFLKRVFPKGKSG